MSFYGIAGYWIPNLMAESKLLKNKNFNSILREELGDIIFKTLMESLINPPALGYLNDQILFFHLYIKEKGCPWATHQKTWEPALTDSVL